MNTLYLYLGLGLVVMSGLALVLVYHRQIRPHLPAQDKDKTPVVQTPVITPPTAAELEAQLKLAYEHLKATSDRLSQNVERLTTSVIEEELTSYKNTLEEVRKVATETMEQIHQSVEDQRVELHQNMETELAGERKRLVEQFDARMGDIVSSYVAESLGGGVDLGSQLQYITQTLESNRDEIKKDLLGGV
jgi:DNA repair exonuclease SbcCD ATPase subunit